MGPFPAGNAQSIASYELVMAEVARGAQRLKSLRIHCAPDGTCLDLAILREGLGAGTFCTIRLPFVRGGHRSRARLVGVHVTPRRLWLLRGLDGGSAALPRRKNNARPRD